MADRDEALAETMTSDAPPSTRAPKMSEWPASIGRFSIESKLGEGGMGVVLLATDPTLGRRVALKLLRAGRDTSPEGRGRFLREAQVMARLTHENVVVVHEVGEHDGHAFVAMEYVEGSTLNGWAKGKTWRNILAIYLRAGRGLDAAHRAGLVHRDFKPDNVLVGADGRVRVSDFGLAGFDGAPPERSNTNSDPIPTGLTRTGALMGTPRYMAPEQHLGAPLDGRADQFAYCVALFEALYGAPPFSGATYADISAAVLDGKPRVPDDANVPPAVRDALLRGLSREPADRFASMSELLAALENAMTTRRSRRWWIPVALLVVAGAAVAIAFALRDSSTVANTAPSGSGSSGSSAAVAIDDADDGRVRVIIGTFDGDAMTDAIRAQSRPQVAALLAKAAPDLHVRLVPGPSDEVAGRAGRAFQIDVSLLQLDAGEGGNVKCKISQRLLAYPTLDVLGFLNGSASVQGKGATSSLRDLEVAGADCTYAVLEDMLTGKIVPAIRRRIDAGSAAN